LKVEATPKTAALSGAWAALGLSIFEPWLNGHAFDTTTTNVVWLVVAAIFVVVPAAVFVFGAWARRAAVSGQFSREDWAQFGKVGVRIVCWLIGAGITGMVIVAAERAASAI
jgi:hypothetical protein